MGTEIQGNVSGSSEIWMTNKSDKGHEISYSSDFSAYFEDEEAFSNHSFSGVSFRPGRTKSCTLTHELRMFVGTWNVGGRSPGHTHNLSADLDQWLNLKSAVDIYVLGFQEVVPLIAKTFVGVLEDQSESSKWNILIRNILNKKKESMSPVMDGAESSGNETYKLVASKRMVGVLVAIWMKTEMLRKYSVSNVKVCSVACGIMGRLGNKGSVSVSMSIEGTSFCFVNAHLASGEKKGDETRRNQQVSEIFKRATFSQAHHGSFIPLPLDILGHDRIFWFGDLNYRLNLEDGLARELIRCRNYKELQKFDQLKKELEGGGVLQGWNEGSIEFAPTYKYYLSNTNCYTVNLPTRSGDKHRTPAWCDRILWHGKGIHQMSYVCGDSKFSDHRPVSALFTTEIQILSSIHPSPNLRRRNKKKGKKKVAEEPKTTLGELIKREAEGSSIEAQ